MEGLFGKPTVINNVISFATVPIIFERGAEFFRDFGAGNSRGTMPFQLAGNVEASGADRNRDGRDVARTRRMSTAAAPPAAGRCARCRSAGRWARTLPSRCSTCRSTTRRSRRAAECSGHGGIVVFDDTVDMAQMARYAMEFCAVESCGKCTPCRIGSTRGVEVIDEIVNRRRSARESRSAARSLRHDEVWLAVRAGRPDAAAGAERAEIFSRRFRSQRRAMLTSLATDLTISTAGAAALMRSRHDSDFATPLRRASVEASTLEIDGRSVTRARRNVGDSRGGRGRDRVPKLCATDSLEPFGSCRLCLVEIEGQRGYPASCTTPVRSWHEGAHRERGARERCGAA